MFVYKTFAVLIFLLIKENLKEIDSIIIDSEYPGREALIKKHLMELIRRGGYRFDPSIIYFTEIGKESNAHITAISVFRKNEKADLSIKSNNLLEWIV